MEIQRDLTGRGNFIGPIFAAIFLAQKISLRDPAKSNKKHVSWYWKKREEIYNLCDSINKSDLVKAADLKIDFYKDYEIDCPHHRRRKQCEDLYIKFLVFKLCQENPFSSDCFDSDLKIISEDIRKIGKDLSKDNLDVFYSPTPPSLQKISTVRLKPPKGAPVKQISNFAIKEIVDRLIRSGLSQSKSCDHCSKILDFCLGIKMDSDTLSRQYRRLKEKQ